MTAAAAAAAAVVLGCEEGRPTGKGVGMAHVPSLACPVCFHRPGWLPPSVKLHPLNFTRRRIEHSETAVELARCYYRGRERHSVIDS